MGKDIKNCNESVLLKDLIKYLKECYKSMEEKKQNVYTPNVYFEQWHSANKERKWVETRISFGWNTYHFTEKMISDNEFIELANKALFGAKCLGKVKTYEETEFYGLWRTIKHIKFDEIMLFAKPCKDFVKLQRIVKKYTNTDIKDFDVYTASIFGKRTPNYSESNKKYLCYNEKRCLDAIEWIKKNRSTKNVLSVNIKEEIDRGEDYEDACRRETEWYGSKANNLKLCVVTPSGKEKSYSVY